MCVHASMHASDSIMMIAPELLKLGLRINYLDWSAVTLTSFLRSNEAILDLPFPDDNLLPAKGLNIE